MKTVVIILLSCACLFAQKFASIGDYGIAGSDELAVANLVKSWNPDFIITLGDNNYPDGYGITIDENIGQYFHEFIFPYVGPYGQSSDVNRFFPSPGNHDHNNPDHLQPYLDYFDLTTFSGTSGNERYYDFIWGNVHFFSINSCTIEPDGYTHPSVQSAWLEAQMTNCTLNHSHWRIVYFHHTPYSSGSHGSTSRMQWPFSEWGADVVMAAHDHTYERIILDDFPYFVNGLGGKSRYIFDPPIPGSIIRYNEKYGAMLMEADEASITFSFYNIDNELIDFYEILRTIPNAPSDLVAEINIFPLSVELSWVDNSNNEDGFIIERETQVAENFEVVDTVSQNVMNYLDTSITSATYVYRAKAFNAAGESEYSDTAQVFVPVELISFTANVVEEGVLLEWTTVSETNNMGFDIQKKNNLSWSSLGFIDGQGSSTTIQYYQYLDNRPQAAKVNSYRLKQIDYDGSFEYSKTVSVIMPSKTFLLEQNYPNPFNPSTKIRYELPDDGQVTIKLFDIFGQEVATLLNEFKRANIYELEFSASDLASGVYIYKMQVGDHSESKKMVLLK
jgi:hypothetical protein